MARRRASQPELQALTHTTLALTLLTWQWTPGWAAFPATAIAYYALITTTALALRWDTAHTLTHTHNILRTHAATTIRALAWLTTALATTTLHALATAHRHTLPTN
jgi:hypothetical protein